MFAGRDNPGSDYVLGEPADDETHLCGDYPARDEAENLTRLAVSGCADRRSDRVIVVDDGSADGSREVITALATVYPWMRGLESRGADERRPAGDRTRRRPQRHRLQHRNRRAQQPDVLVKLDADVSFEPNFFELLLRAFEDRTSARRRRVPELEKGVWR